MNSAAVWPNSRCSSLKSSRTNTSAASAVRVRNCPPLALTGACACVMGFALLTASRVAKYKLDSVPSINELFRLDGRIAIVTGGSRGLGQEMAEGLAEAGASLMLCARREQWLGPALEAMRGRGYRAEGQVCDVSDPQQVERAVAATLQAFGRVDILINNAGISWGASPEDMTLEQWRKVLDTNLTGAFLFAQAAGREMLKAKSGAIVNVASVAGLRSAVHGPHYAGYVASKA